MGRVDEDSRSVKYVKAVLQPGHYATPGRPQQIDLETSQGGVAARLSDRPHQFAHPQCVITFTKSSMFTVQSWLTSAGQYVGQGCGQVPQLVITCTRSSM